MSELITRSRKIHCGNCGQVGHNRMTCGSAMDPGWVPQGRYVATKTRCSRCGEKGHNVVRCTATEVTRVADRCCLDCGRGLANPRNGSMRCRSCDVKRRAIQPRPCDVCGIEYQPGRHRGRTCSEECRRAAITKASTGLFEKLTGSVFGWWTVIAHTTAKTCAVRCRCGFETLVKAGTLKAGTSSSCRACVARRRFEEMSAEEREERAAFARAEKNRSKMGAHEKRPGETPKQATLRRRDERRKLINEYKRRPCQDCGGRFAPVCMDFDHRQGEEKVGGVSRMAIQCSSFDVIIAEMQKCDLVCSNCHRVRTHRRMLDEQGVDDVSGSLTSDINTLPCQ